MVKNTLNFIKDKKLEFILLVIIVSLAIFFRFYQLDSYMTFLGDEGRDAIIIKNLLVNYDLPFIGAPTSFGNIYAGPLYYYMMAASMAIFWLNPVAAAGMVAMIGVLTVILVYIFTRWLFGSGSGLIAALLYAISPVNIIGSRSSWNPNPLPFFSLLSMMTLYLAHKNRDFRWFILTGLFLGGAIQMHYLALILIFTVAILWLFELRKWLLGTVKHFVFGTIGAVLGFLITLIPWFMFEYKHNFLNLKALKEFFLGSQSGLGTSQNIISDIYDIFFHGLVYRYIGGQNDFLSFLTGTLLLVVVGIGLIYLRKNWTFMMMFLWLSIGIVGLSIYKGTVYDHYLNFLNPVPFIILGSLWYLLKGGGRLIYVGLVIILVVVNFQNNPLQYSPNNQLDRTKSIANYVIEQSANKPFNFALIAKNNYDAAYQFYFDQYGHAPKVVPEEKTDQLFVVCEDQVCEPINHPKYEIAGFGWAKIESVSEFSGVKVFKLVANPSGKPS